MSIDNPRASTVGRAAATVACEMAGLRAAAAQSELGAQLVEDLHSAFGKHRARAVYAKGVILEGSFTPAPAAPALSKAATFAEGAVAVTAALVVGMDHPDADSTEMAGTCTRFTLR